MARRFLELRDEDLVGGLVVRRFEEFTTAEVRTWWVNGRCAPVTAHPDTPSSGLPGDVDTAAVANAVEALASPFVTVDLAERAGGGWRVVEVGDGQVSDRPSSTPPHQLIEALVGG